MGAEAGVLRRPPPCASGRGVDGGRVLDHGSVRVMNALASVEPARPAAPPEDDAPPDTWSFSPAPAVRHGSVAARDTVAGEAFRTFVSCRLNVRPEMLRSLQ